MPENGAVQAIFSVTFPFFALVLCGYVAARVNLLPEIAIPGLNLYVLYFSLPCMLFRFGAGMPVAELFNPPLMLIYVACALVMVGLSIALTLGGRIGIKDAAFGALVAAFPNTGFMGVPLLVALFGSQAAGPAIITILIDLILTSSLCIAVAQTQGSDRHGMQVAVLRALRGALVNPLPWAIAAGAFMSFLGGQFPAPVSRVVTMLGDSASPVALFTIGAVLARGQRHATQRTPLMDYLPLALLKLILHPLLVLMVGLNAIRLGWPIDRFSLMMMTLAAALPSASNVSILAERYGADNSRVAKIILASTVLAFLTFSGFVWWLPVEAYRK